MDRQELHDLLISKMVDPKLFDVLGNDPDPFPGDMFVLRHVPHLGGRPEHWATYYTERGGQHFLRRFQSEDEACRDLLLRLVKEPTDAR